MSTFLERLKEIQDDLTQVKATTEAVAMVTTENSQNLRAVIQELVRLRDEFNNTRELYTNLADYLLVFNSTLPDETKDLLTQKVLELQVERRKGMVKSSIDSGQIVSAEEVAPDSFLVLEEVLDGKTTNPYDPISIGNLTPEHQQKVLGQKVGFELSLKENHILKVIEIYSRVVVNETKQA